MKFKVGDKVRLVDVNGCLDAIKPFKGHTCTVIRCLAGEHVEDEFVDVILGDKPKRLFCRRFELEENVFPIGMEEA